MFVLLALQAVANTIYARIGRCTLTLTQRTTSISSTAKTHHRMAHDLSHGIDTNAQEHDADGAVSRSVGGVHLGHVLLELRAAVHLVSDAGPCQVMQASAWYAYGPRSDPIRSDRSDRLQSVYVREIDECLVHDRQQ